MSKYTTELRFICENLAGFNESVRLNKFDEVIDLAIPKVFNFDFPIWDESYREVLERKILTNFYTREIGYETFGRWQLALRNKLNNIMPYYNILYENAGRFGKLNIFDNVNYSSYKSGSENVDTRNEENANNNDSITNVKNENQTVSSTNSNTVNRNLSSNSGEIFDSKTTVNDTENKTEDITKNKTGNVSYNKNGNEGEFIDSKTVITGSENNTSTHDSTGSQQNIANSENEESSKSNGNTSSVNQSVGESSSENNSIKRQLYSDTPSGALDFGELTENTGGGSDNGISNNFITNLTKNIDENTSKNNTSSNGHSVGLSSEEINRNGKNKSVGSNTSSLHDTSTVIGNVNNDESKKQNAVKNWNENDVKTESENNTDRNVVTGSKNGEEVKKHNYIKNENLGDNKTENFTGNKNINGNITDNSTKIGVANKNRIGNVKTTEVYVDTIKGKIGDKSYSVLFEEFKHALVNVDQMVLEELSTLFIGLWE